MKNKLKDLVGDDCCGQNSWDVSRGWLVEGDSKVHVVDFTRRSCYAYIHMH